MHPDERDDVLMFFVFLAMLIALIVGFMLFGPHGATP